MKRWIFTGAIVGLFVIMMIAAAVQGTPAIHPPSFDPPDIPIPEQTADSSPLPTGPISPDPTAELVTRIIGIVFLVLLAAAAVLIVALIVRTLVRAWRDRPLSTQDGTEVEPEHAEHAEHAAPAEPEAAAPALRRGIAGALRTIHVRPVPTDAIIAAWIGLEESAADAGIARGISETSAEFALRIINRRSGITQPARDLLRLYERVRFGGYIADESDRDVARAALHRIEEGWR